MGLALEWVNPISVLRKLQDIRYLMSRPVDFRPSLRWCRLFADMTIGILCLSFPAGPVYVQGQQKNATLNSDFIENEVSPPHGWSTSTNVYEQDYDKREITPTLFQAIATLCNSLA